MTMYLTKSRRKRELATVYRMGFEMAGILIALLIQGLLTGNNSSECKSINETVVTNTIINESQKYFFVSVIFVIITIISIILFFAGTSENLGIIAFIIFFVLLN